MKTENAEALVLTDGQGNYFVLPAEYIELSKVAPEAKAAIDKEMIPAKKRVNLGAGFSSIGVVSRSQDENWPGFDPTGAWPHYGEPSS